MAGETVASNGNKGHLGNRKEWTLIAYCPILKKQDAACFWSSLGSLPGRPLKKQAAARRL
jgi:hypothetical protein